MAGQHLRKLEVAGITQELGDGGVARLVHGPVGQARVLEATSPPTVRGRRGEPARPRLPDDADGASVELGAEASRGRAGTPRGSVAVRGCAARAPSVGPRPRWAGVAPCRPALHGQVLAV